METKCSHRMPEVLFIQCSDIKKNISINVYISFLPFSPVGKGVSSQSAVRTHSKDPGSNNTNLDDFYAPVQILFTTVNITKILILAVLKVNF